MFSAESALRNLAWDGQRKQEQSKHGTGGQTMAEYIDKDELLKDLKDKCDYALREYCWSGEYIYELRLL